MDVVQVALLAYLAFFAYRVAVALRQRGAGGIAAYVLEGGRPTLMAKAVVLHGGVAGAPAIRIDAPHRRMHVVWTDGVLTPALRYVDGRRWWEGYVVVAAVHGSVPVGLTSPGLPVDFPSAARWAVRAVAASSAVVSLMDYVVERMSRRRTLLDLLRPAMGRPARVPVAALTYMGRRLAVLYGGTLYEFPAEYDGELLAAETPFGRICVRHPEMWLVTDYLLRGQFHLAFASLDVEAPPPPPPGCSALATPVAISKVAETLAAVTVFASTAVASRNVVRRAAAAAAGARLDLRGVILVAFLLVMFFLLWQTLPAALGAISKALGALG